MRLDGHGVVQARSIAPYWAPVSLLSFQSVDYGDLVNHHDPGIVFSFASPCGFLRRSAALRVARGGEFVPERPGVVVLDVIHHVGLPDVDRAELVVEPDAGDRLLA